MNNAVETALSELKESIKKLEKHLSFVEYAHADTKTTYDMTTTVDGFAQVESISREEFLEFVVEDTFNVLFFEIDNLKIEVFNKLVKLVNENEPKN